MLYGTFCVSRESRGPVLIGLVVWWECEHTHTHTQAFVLSQELGSDKVARAVLMPLHYSVLV